MHPDGNPTPAPSSEPAAAAPADNQPPAGGETPPAPAADPTPAPKTIDPVDHSKPADPAPAAEDPDTPADPATPEGEEPGDGTDEDPTIADVLATPEEDETSKALQERQDKGQDLPSGVNPDGTINPLVYAYENLPTIKVMGKVGNGKVQEYDIKTADDLPDGFRFADAKAQTMAAQAIQQNINLATGLIDEAKEYNTNRSAQLQRQQVAATQKTEIDTLQEEGLLPKFSKQPTDKGFMETPEAQRAQAVLDFMKEHNAEVAKTGVGQEVTSVRLGLMLLQAKEANDARDGRMINC